MVVKKVDSTNPNKTLPGARFLVASENGAYSKEVVTGSDGTVTVPNLEAGTYAVTELEAPEGYEIDNPGPQYVHHFLGVGAIFRGNKVTRSGQSLVGIGGIHLLDRQAVLFTGDVQFPHHDSLHIVGGAAAAIKL